jgi:hypothetical protein
MDTVLLGVRTRIVDSYLGNRFRILFSNHGFHVDAASVLHAAGQQREAPIPAASGSSTQRGYASLVLFKVCLIQRRASACFALKQNPIASSCSKVCGTCKRRGSLPGVRAMQVVPDGLQEKAALDWGRRGEIGHEPIVSERW